MASIEEQVAALTAREAIRDLPKRYCDCVWRDDIEGITNLFTEDGTFKAPEALKAAFAQAGVDPEQPAVTTCGSGVTASVLALGFFVLGQQTVPVYDGSWAEWGGRSDTPVETSATSSSS